jgi:hypothetical protein
MGEQPDLFAPGVAEAAAARPLALASHGDLEQRFVAFGVEALDDGDVLALVLARAACRRAPTVRRRPMR